MPTRARKIFFDGGCRPNPGTIELAVVARGQVTIVRDAGQGDNHDAEWLALIHAARIAQAMPDEAVVLLGDAAAVIAQATGRVRAQGRAARHLAELRALFDGAVPRIRYVGRAQNLAGIALAALHPR
jgi:ribonuclease HI